MTTIVVKIITLCAMSLLLLSPEFFSVLAPRESYADGLYATAPLIVASIFAFLYTIVAGVNLERARTWRLALTTLLCALIGVLITVPATVYYGFVGSAVATALSYIILTLAHAHLLTRTAGRDLLPLPLVSTFLTLSSLIPTTAIAYYLKDYPLLRFLLLLIPLLLLLDLALRSRTLLEEREASA